MSGGQDRCARCGAPVRCIARYSNGVATVVERLCLKDGRALQRKHGKRAVKLGELDPRYVDLPT